MSLTKFTGLARKLPSPLYKLFAQSFIDTEFPRHIFIETCASCNLSCSYCPREKRNENMDFELFKNIIDECSEYGPRSFSLHLFGEPLLYPHIIDAINYIKSRNKRHTILLTTNGTVLNKFAKRLLGCGVDRLIWSWRKLDVPFSSDTIEVMRKIGMVRILIEETPEEEVVKWSKFPRVEIKHLHNYGGDIDLSKWGYIKKQDKRYPCYHLWLAPAIRWNGDMVFCCNVSKHTVYSTLGNVLQHKISDMWKSDQLNEVRNDHKQGVYKDACRSCDSWKAYPSIF